MTTKNLEGLFKLYDKANPQVYEWFKHYALELKLSGAKQVGAKLIFERIRWEVAVKTKPESGMPKLKLNNNYTAYYARKLVAEDPSFWQGFFDFRKVSSDELVESL